MARAELLWPYVEKTLTEFLGDHIQRIDEHVIAVQHGSSRVLIRLLEADEPRLQIFSPMLQGVSKSPELLDALNDLNARLAYVKVFWIEQDVMLATELLAGSLDRDSVLNGIQVVATSADQLDDQLKKTFGGETSFAEPEVEAEPSADAQPGADGPHAGGAPEGVGLPPGMEQGEPSSRPPTEPAPPADEEPAAAKPDREDQAPGYL